MSRPKDFFWEIEGQRGPMLAEEQDDLVRELNSWDRLEESLLAEVDLLEGLTAEGRELVRSAIRDTGWSPQARQLALMAIGERDQALAGAIWKEVIRVATEQRLGAQEGPGENSQGGTDG